MLLGEETTPLHLKIKAWHMNNTALGVSPGPPRIDHIKSFLIPSQELLKHIDPDGTQSDDYVTAILRPKADEWNMCNAWNVQEKPQDKGYSWAKASLFDGRDRKG